MQEPQISAPPPTPTRTVAPRAPRFRSPWLAVVLFVVTLLTLSLAGGLYWSEPVDPTSAMTLPALLLGVLLAGVPYALSAVAVLGAHEMGHYLACRYYGIPATLPMFLPGPPYFGTLGAVIRIRGRIPHRRALFDVAAAGPLAGFAVALPLFALGLARADALPTSFVVHAESMRLGQPAIRHLLGAWLSAPETIQVNAFYAAGWFGMLITALNLFPVGQLDGGHLAFALSRRLHRVLAWTTILVIATLVAGQAMRGNFPVYLLWLAILLFLRDRHPPVLDDREALGPGRLLVALLLFVIFLLAFTPLPIRIVSG